MRRHLTSLFVWNLLLSGCLSLGSFPKADAGNPQTTDAGTKSDAGNLGPSLANVCSVINTRKCEYLQRCRLIAPGPLRDCIALMDATECGPSLWPARVSAGTLAYQPAAAQRCADAYPSWSCEQFATAPDDCLRLYTAKSPYGAFCYDGAYSECRDGVCRGLCSPARACQPPGLVNELCEQDHDCRTDAGLYCHASGSGLFGTCQAHGGMGTACGGGERCADGMFCSSSTFKCEPRRELGTPCTQGTCVDDAWCFLPPQDAGTCVSSAQRGGSCTDDVQCASGLLCQTQTQTCQPQGSLLPGEPCSARQTCSAGLACVGAQGGTLGSCAAPLDAGTRCNSSEDCVADLACNRIDAGVSTCGPRVKDGMPCTSARDCWLLSDCLSGRCTRLAATGEPCVPGSCRAGTCTPSVDGGLLCAPLGAPNAPCQVNADCASGQCAGGKCLAACVP